MGKVRDMEWILFNGNRSISEDYGCLNINIGLEWLSNSMTRTRDRILACIIVAKRAALPDTSHCKLGQQLHTSLEGFST